MANKVIIGILVLLAVLMGGTGYYSYALNRSIDRLDQRLVSFEQEEIARDEAVSNELADMRTETGGRFNSFEEQIDQAQIDINALQEQVAEIKTKINTVENEIAGFSDKVASLDERISSAEADISNSRVNASELYEKVSPATVRISNGQTTVGSGFLFDTSYYIVTAYHVIDGLLPLFVIMWDGTTSRATVVGYCEISDVAVLRLIDYSPVAPLLFGDSSLLQIGDPVLAIGSPGDGDNPLGLRDSLTSGIISQVNRDVLVEDTHVTNLLQFDAAVNFGNSGGPLINSQGEVIGLVTARIDPTRGDGINWAVASNKVKRVADSILTTGSFEYPWIGIEITDFTPQLVEDISAENANGVLVKSVLSGTPADIAGVNDGDIITGIDGVPVRDSGELTSYLGEYESPGDEVVLDVIRDAAGMEIILVVGTRE
jgi:S1-C subfamily serine protease